jgi:ABC-2 type transport system ATP-binding protein
MRAVGDAIEVEGLRKRYRTRQALCGVSFAVRPGEIVGLLGPNGAGKSTTLGILATQLVADTGSVRIAGHALPAEAAAARAVTGLVPQREALYPSLSARENLRFFACMLGLARAAAEAATTAALTMVALEKRADEPIRCFSVGMRRRLNLACGVLHRPPVLLLDEPTVGVDPQSRERIFESVGRLAGEGAAVLYSTHYMEEAERLCRRVLLLDEGVLVAHGTPAELVAAARLQPSIHVRTRRPLPADWLRGLSGVRLIRHGGVESDVEIDHPEAVASVLLAAARFGDEVDELRLHRPDLADVFFALTGRGLRDAGEATSG